jgi:hypothetical protein
MGLTSTNWPLRSVRAPLMHTDMRLRFGSAVKWRSRLRHGRHRLHSSQQSRSWSMRPSESGSSRNRRSRLVTAAVLAVLRPATGRSARRRTCQACTRADMLPQRGHTPSDVVVRASRRTTISESMTSSITSEDRPGNRTAARSRTHGGDDHRPAPITRTGDRWSGARSNAGRAGAPRPAWRQERGTTGSVRYDACDPPV